MIKRFELILLFIVLSLGTPKAFGAGNAAHGKKLFSEHGCIGCHAVKASAPPMAGPNLAGITKKHKRKWLLEWLRHPNSMKKDPEIIKLKHKFPVSMPPQTLSAQDVDDILAYLKSAK